MNTLLTLPRRLMLPFALSLAAWAAPPAARSSATPAPPIVAAAAQGAGAAARDSSQCPLRAADLDRLTPYRWQFGQFKADRVYIPSVTIRIDFCELVGLDAKGQMRTAVTVNIARGANAEAFARHWRDVCAASLMPEARGTVQPVPGVPGGQRCVTANGGASVYWLESAGRTIQIEPQNEAVAWGEIFPRLLAAAR